MFNLRIVKESDFIEIDLPESVHEGKKTGFKYIFNHVQDFEKEIVIAPHYNETYISLELFKLAIHCKKNKVKITSIGSMNQFTFFGTFSDEVICLKDTHLHNIYASNYSSFGTDGSYFHKIPNYVDIYKGGMDMNAFPEANQISIDEVIEAFTFPPLYVRDSTFNYFNSLDLPSDIIYCEIKNNFYPKLLNFIKNNFPDAIGVDKSFQRSLLKEAKDHFMGVQLLASLYKGWQFIAAGGSVNLFNVLPVRPLLFLENSSDLTDDFVKAAKSFGSSRYNANPILINFSPRIMLSEVDEAQDYSMNSVDFNSLKSQIGKAFDQAKTLNTVRVRENTITSKLASKKVTFDNEIKIKINNKVINWIFQYHHDYNFFKKNILEWALEDAGFDFSNEDPDFTVGVYINDQNTFDKINSLSSQKFLLSAESHTRHPVLDNCHSFVQDARPNDDLSYIKYAPTMCCWSPPFKKSSKFLNILNMFSDNFTFVSALDSGRYSWRNDLINNLKSKLSNKLDVFGGLSNRHLGGYHCNTNSNFLNEKYESLLPYLFGVAIENDTAKFSKEEYITEKVTDPILCETIPICSSAPNLDRYFFDGSYILYEDFENLDFANLKNEYLMRRDQILKQKEFIRTSLNVFSYFNKLSNDLSLLNKTRPITLR
jgi:hypothetical protein